MKTPNFKAVIIDDEHDAREIIALLLNDMFPAIDVAEKANGVAAGCKAVAAHNPDIVFLDIEMADGTGFDFLARNPRLTCPVIFVTAYDNYAIQAIKASAFDYLLKPLNRDEFRQAVNKALGKLEQAQLYNMVQQATDVRKIGIPNLTGLTFVDVDTIVRCDADGNYTTVYFTNAPKATVSRTLSHFENDLKRYGFFRIHHKHLVNLKQVRSYIKGKGGGAVTMSDSATLEVSARKKPDLLKILSQIE